jgi:hypothetical protein
MKMVDPALGSWVIEREQLVCHRILGMGAWAFKFVAAIASSA